MVKCPLCGFEYMDDRSDGACSECPLHIKKCNMIKCPNCGYKVPKEPKFLKIIRDMWRQKWNFVKSLKSY